MSFSKKVAVRPLFYLLVGLFFVYLLYHSLAGETLLSTNYFDSYSLQAENWLAGRASIANGEYYTWLELAVYQGDYYLSFPAVPSVLLLPWVIAFGGASAVPSNLVIALFALATVAGVYLLFAHFGASVQTCLFWALLSCVGSNFFWISTSGGVWFMAQVLNLCLVVWGLYFATYRGLVGNLFAALLLALAVGCRPFSIFILALYFLRLWLPRLKESVNPLRWGAGFWLPFVVAFCVGLALAWYNFIRFGSILEFGHNYLPEFMEAEYGQFHLSYFWDNFTKLFRPVTLNAALGLEFEIFNGFCLFAANPIYLLWLVTLIQRIWRKQYTPQEGLCAALLCVSIALLCCHKTMGGWQFGVRYLVDYIPYLWLCALQALRGASGTLTAAGAETDPNVQCGLTPVPRAQNPADWQWFLCALAMAFNIYGALYML